MFGAGLLRLDRVGVLAEVVYALESPGLGQFGVDQLLDLCQLVV